MTQSLPHLNPREHALLEKLAGHKLSNEEAQAFQKQQRLLEATDQLCRGPVKSRDVLRGDV
jgi:hypothetical protein